MYIYFRALNSCLALIGCWGVSANGIRWNQNTQAKKARLPFCRSANGLTAPGSPRLGELLAFSRWLSTTGNWVRYFARNLHSYYVFVFMFFSALFASCFLFPCIVFTVILIYSSILQPSYCSCLSKCVNMCKQACSWAGLVFSESRLTLIQD